MVKLVGTQKNMFHWLALRQKKSRESPGFFDSVAFCEVLKLDRTGPVTLGRAPACKGAYGVLRLTNFICQASFRLINEVVGNWHGEPLVSSFLTLLSSLSLSLNLSFFLSLSFLLSILTNRLIRFELSIRITRILIRDNSHDLNDTRGHSFY